MLHFAGRHSSPHRFVKTLCLVCHQNPFAFHVLHIRLFINPDHFLEPCPSTFKVHYTPQQFVAIQRRGSLAFGLCYTPQILTISPFFFDDYTYGGASPKTTNQHYSERPRYFVPLTDSLPVGTIEGARQPTKQHRQPRDWLVSEGASIRRKTHPRDSLRGRT